MSSVGESGSVCKELFAEAAKTTDESAKDKGKQNALPPIYLFKDTISVPSVASAGDILLVDLVNANTLRHHSYNVKVPTHLYEKGKLLCVTFKGEYVGVPGGISVHSVKKIARAAVPEWPWAEATVVHTPAPEPEPVRKTVSKKRSASEDAYYEKLREDIKQRLTPDEQLLKELECPISGKLPIDPVTAEDGRVYERVEIENWFSQTRDDTAKSPMTGLMIGKGLFPAVQTRNTIERLVARRLIDPKEGSEWKEGVDEVKNFTDEMKNLMSKASKGDKGAMVSVGFCYRDGTKGARMNKAKSFKWFERASLAGSAVGAQAVGIAYINGGCGVPKDVSRGLVELTRSAMLGSEHAAFCLGNHHAKGIHVKKDEKAATFWYQVSRDADIRDTLDEYKEQRNKWLREHGQV